MLIMWREPEFTLHFDVHVAQSLIFCVVFCWPLFVFLFFYSLVIVLPVLLQFTASDHHKSSNHYLFLPFRLYDKRDDFNFAITNFPPLDSTTCTQPLPRVEFLFHSLYAMLEVAVFIQTIHNDAVLNQWLIWFLVFNTTFSNISAISWRPVLVVEEAGAPGENHRPCVSNW